MTISASDLSIPAAVSVAVNEDTLAVDLSDGRSLSVPLAWYPRLLHATPDERANWRFVGDGQGIHWPDLDEDISVAGMVAGHPSTESSTSLRRWLAARKR